MEEFKEGDIVQLKSGGPKMTIQSVESEEFGKNEPGLLCQWFSGSKLNSGHFSAVSIIKVSDENEKK